MVLVLNGIPVFAFELKNQYTGQTVDDAKRQWSMTATAGALLPVQQAYSGLFLRGSHRGVDDHKARRKEHLFPAL